MIDVVVWNDGELHSCTKHVIFVDINQWKNNFNTIYHSNNDYKNNQTKITKKKNDPKNKKIKHNFR